MTGYTYKIARRDVSLREFALDCARAMGPMACMRDMGGDGESIPSEFVADPSFRRSLDEAEDSLKELQAMSEEQQNEMVNRINSENEMKTKDSARKDKEIILRLSCVLGEVLLWEPPEELIPLKNFMIEQVRSSISDQRCFLNQKPSQVTFLQLLKSAERDVVSSRELYEEEVNRCKWRTNWVMALRESLDKFESEMKGVQE